MLKLNAIFTVPKPVIGMVHLKALPGTPKYKGDVKAIIATALEEANIYKKAGIDGLAIENMHDVPYLKNKVGHEISSLMAIVAHEIKRLFGLPTGLQILSSANEAALAVAHSAGLDFIRAEGFVFGHLADEGYVDACAGNLLRYRKKIGAENIAVWTDIKKKHSSHALTSDVDIVETAKAAEYFLSDGLIITGGSTGESAKLEEIKAVKKACQVPVIVGSGITFENVDEYLPVCDAMVVGSYFKVGGHWANELDKHKIERLMEKVGSMR